MLEHYRQRFQHIVVVEYQVTYQAQTELVLLLADVQRNVCVVGDTDQCLPPGTMIDGPAGRRPIEEIAIGDEVFGAGGHAETQVGTVTHVHEGNYDGHVVEITSGDAVVRATPHHLVPARLLPRPDQWLVYLMYRADRGWRIGRTVGARPPRGGALQHGLVVRTNQEHADAAWILKVCGSVAEAAYFESWFSAEYGLPTVCFHVSPGDAGDSEGRNLAMSDGWLQQLYRSIDTDTRAKLLMDERLLHREFPHHRPQNGARRSSINLTMFSDRRSQVGYHRVQWSSNRPDVIEALRRGGVKLRSSKHRSLRYETSWKD